MANCFIFIEPKQQGATNERVGCVGLFESGEWLRKIARFVAINKNAGCKNSLGPRWRELLLPVFNDCFPWWAISSLP
ncbi:hypothetical protein [Sunxiuqinia sp. sy24]|uniref:hypothetical protein n=1 Tax=Sunxiuqinia sp. sy24 TaxID=3461495 RepID=UPI0040465239